MCVHASFALLGIPTVTGVAATEIKLGFDLAMSPGSPRKRAIRGPSTTHIIV